MIKKIVGLLALLQAIALNLHAAAPKPLPTNFVQTISLQFTVDMPGAIAPSGLSGAISSKTFVTKDAIQAIGASSGMQYSSKAQFVCVQSIFYDTFVKYITNGAKITTTMVTNGYLGTASFQIRDGATITDISSLVTPITLNSNQLIAAYKRTPQYQYSLYSNYRVRTITVSNPAFSFSGQGFVTSPLVAVPVAPGIVVYGNNDNWTDFTGVASGSAVSGILQGTLKATYSHVE